MSDRQNNIVCALDHIHEWIYETLRLGEDEISMIQIDGQRSRAFIKFTNGVHMQRLLRDSARKLD